MNQLTFLFVLAFSFLNHPSLAKGFKERILRLHNNKRSNHDVPSLVWNSKLADIAQRLVEYLHKTNQRDYRITNIPYGETRAIMSGNVRSKFIEWYNQSKDYDFKKGKSKSNKMTGDFTQVVWQDSYYIGCGQKRDFLLCFYYPPGNIENQYLKNVFTRRVPNID